MMATLIPSVVMRLRSRAISRLALQRTVTLGANALVETYANAAEQTARVAVKKDYTHSYLLAKKEADAVGHICADWEFNMDDESPLEWCPACRHMEVWRQSNPEPSSIWQGEPRSTYMSAEQVETSRQARWNAWVKKLPEWDLMTLRAGGLAAKILVRESFYGEHVSWAAKEEMMNPDYFKASQASLKSTAVAAVVVKAKKAVVVIKKAPAAPKPAGWGALEFSDSDGEESPVAEAVLDNGFTAPVPEAAEVETADMTFEEYERFCREKEHAVFAAEAAAVADGWCAAGSKPKKATTPDPFNGLGVEAWLARKNPNNSGPARSARQRELETWLGEAPRRAFTSAGYQAYKKYASAGRSSALFNGADGIDLADIRLIAAQIAPVRDIFRPRTNNSLIFVEFLDAGAAAQAKLVFGEHPLRMWNRAIYVDVAKPKASH
jgi:hypothetical protein